MKKMYSLLPSPPVFLFILGCLAFFSCKKEETPIPTVTYTVTFNTRGGDPFSTIKVQKGKTITRPTAELKKGDSVIEN